MGRLVGSLSTVLGFVLLAAAGWWLYQGPAEGAPEGGRPPYMLPVTLVDVDRSDVAPEVLLTGTVRSVARAQLAFETEGVLEELALREADEMEMGQVLARLRARDAELTLAAAQADLALAETQLARLEAGERVEDIQRLSAVHREAEARAKLAATEIERQRKLRADNIVSQSELDRAVAEHEAAVARAEAAEETLAAARAGSRVEDVAIAEARVEVEKANTARAREDLEKVTLRAPHAGVVLRRLVAVGDYLTRGMPVYEVVDLNQLEVEVEIPSRYAALVAGRPEVELTLDELPDFRMATVMDARIPAADARSRNFRGLVRFEAEAPGADVLRPGMFVRVTVQLDPTRDALVVPSDAVRITDGGAVVVRAQQGDGGLSAVWVPVRVLATDTDRSAIAPIEEGSLEKGAQVVLTGVDLAFPGAPLLSQGGPSAPEAPSEEASQ